MKFEKALVFLKKYNMHAELLDPEILSKELLSAMEFGLENQTDELPMIPSYLRAGRELSPESTAIAIDAGGTNFRTALVKLGNGSFSVSNLTKKTMPGIDKPAAWSEFISFTADCIMPILELSDDIGFCFSYSADSTPECDAVADMMAKEVVIPDSVGKLIGATLLEELKKRGAENKHVTVLNDTSAVLLGTVAAENAEAYSGFIGMVSGTGFNICCVLPEKRIVKLGSSSNAEMIVNLEAGSYCRAPRGAFDRQLDERSTNPGKHILEKMVAGVYLGEIVRLALLQAARDGELTPASAEKVNSLGKINSAVTDAWASGEGLGEIAADENDGKFVQTLCLELFRRAARADCAYIMALMELTGKGTDKPVLVCAEGSLIQKSRHFRPMLESELAEYVGKRMGRKFELAVGEETTLPGAAAAALLNRK